MSARHYFEWKSPIITVVVLSVGNALHFCKADCHLTGFTIVHVPQRPILLIAYFALILVKQQEWLSIVLFLSVKPDPVHDRGI